MSVYNQNIKKQSTSQLKKNRQMTNIIKKAINMMFGAFDQTALIEGASDIIMVRWNSGKIKSTPFLVCFGPAIAQLSSQSSSSHSHKVTVQVNNRLIPSPHFTLDSHGYIHPMRPTQQFLKLLDKHLHVDQNTITFRLNDQHTISLELYVYREFDKLLISDVDGTMTRDDVGGLWSNFHGQHYLHDGYYQLLDTLYKNRIKIVWLTMRALPLYKFTKQYIQNHTKIPGVLLCQPEQLFSSLKQQLLKKSSTVKTNMLNNVRQLFPSHCNPFVGGLGNRDNDAIAYRAAGIDVDNIFIVDTRSAVHCLGDGAGTEITYHHICGNLAKYFNVGGYKTVRKELSKQQNKQKLFDTSLNQYKTNDKQNNRYKPIQHPNLKQLQNTANLPFFRKQLYQKQNETQNLQQKQNNNSTKKRGITIRNKNLLATF